MPSLNTPLSPRKTTAEHGLTSSRWSQTAVSSRTMRMLVRGRDNTTVATSPSSRKVRVVKGPKDVSYQRNSAVSMVEPGPMVIMIP